VHESSVESQTVLPVDDRLSFLCELKFPGCLRQGEATQFLDVVVDTGAGCGYLIWPDSLPLPVPWWFRDCDISVAMANGQISKVNRVLPAQLEVGGVNYEVELRVLPSSCSRPSILCGRQLIEQLGLVICGSSRLISREGLCLFDSSTDHAPAVVGKNCPRSDEEWESVDQIHAVLDNLNLPDTRFSEMIRPPDDIDEFVLPVPFPSSETAACSVLEKVVSLGDHSMLYCPAATLKLEQLEPLSPRDLPDQTHQFRVCLPVQESRPRRKSYSAALYARLNELQRDQFDQLVDEYVNVGWWKKIEESDPRAANPTDVFLHKAGTPKGRLVCDFRLFNEFFKNVSSSVPLIDNILLLMRTENFEHVFVGDCSKAFYRVALSPPLALRAGDNVFLCERVSFGLSMGPETLRCTLGVLMDHWKSIATEPGFLSVYVDDFQLLCNSDQPINSLLLLLRKCGFAVSKKKFQTTFPLKLFGCVIDRSGNSVTATPPIIDDLKSDVGVLLNRPTKRAVFELAGRVSYDPLKTLPISRLISDLLRSIAGKSKKGWDELVLFSNLEEEKVFRELLEWLIEIDERRIQRSQIREKQDWHLYVDASLFGSGYCLEFNQSVIQESASAWKPSQYSYHSNRLEGLSLLTAMRSLARYFEFREKASFGDSFIKPHVQIFSDSKSAIAWSNGRPPSDSKGLEFRMLMRLQEALTEEFLAFKRLSICSLTHVAGEANSKADNLSRLLYRTVNGKTIGSIFRGAPIEHLDSVAVVTEKPLGLVESLAQGAMDYESLLEKCRVLWSVWNSLRARESFDHIEIEKLMIKSLQTLPFDKSRYVLIDGIYYSQWNNAKGETLSKPVLPRYAEFTRRLVLKYHHRRNGHRGRNFDVAFFLEKGQFFVESLLNGSRDVIKRCLKCALARSATVMPVTPHVEPRQVNLPPFSRIAIDLTYAARRKPVFAALCLDTHLVFFRDLSDSTRESIEEAILVLTNRYLVTLRYIRCDNAPAMNDTFIAKLRRSGHPDLEVSRTPVAGSVANPVERMHRELWTLVRSRGLLKLTSDELEAAAAVINQRPLAIHREGSSVIVITPAKLAFGSSHGVDGVALAAFRQEFYERYFLLYRRRHNSSVRRMLLTISSYVLVSNKAAEWDRAQSLFHIGQVVAIGKGFLTIRFTSGQVKDVSTDMVAPLDRYFFEESTTDIAGDSSEGRVVNNDESVVNNDESNAAT
jgi:hypothetical protein